MNKQEQDIRKKSPVQIRNKKASFEYFFVDTYTAGMVLTGTEIKSIRAGKASLVDSYCVIDRGEIWVKGMNISPYFYGSFSIQSEIFSFASGVGRPSKAPELIAVPS